MATTAVKVAKRRPAKAVDINKRVAFVYVDLNDIVPYEFNARDNEEAIPAVAASIKEFGFLVPCVIDKDNVLVAGHTRVEAAKLLGMTEVPCVRAEHLTQNQVDAFRLVDNKVSELATWNEDLLSGEISRLMDTGIDFSLLGWTKESLDCLQEMVSGDCLDDADQVIAEASSSRVPRGPVRARVVVGSIVFFLTAADYRRWEEGIRALHDFKEEDVIQDIKDRLGIVEGSVEAARRVTRVRRATGGVGRS